MLGTMALSLVAVPARPGEEGGARSSDTEPRSPVTREQRHQYDGHRTQNWDACVQCTSSSSLSVCYYALEFQTLQISEQPEETHGFQRNHSAFQIEGDFQY